MKLNICSDQTTIEKTYEVATYDLMYGTVEDLLGIIEQAQSIDDMQALGKIILENKPRINELLLDIFSSEGLTEQELRRTKVRELIPLFTEIFRMVTATVGIKN
jgi:hypothetical protein